MQGADAFLTHIKLQMYENYICKKKKANHKHMNNNKNTVTHFSTIFDYFQVLKVFLKPLSL